MAGVQGIPGCCCGMCETDASCVTCMPKKFCVNLVFDGGQSYCGDWDCTGDLCGELVFNCGRYSGSITCGDSSVDLTITIKRDDENNCVACLNSTCLGIDDDTMYACQQVSSGDDLDGMSWDFDDFYGCDTSCSNGGTITITESPVCTHGTCTGCGCVSKKACLLYQRIDTADGNDLCQAGKVVEFDCDYGNVEFETTVDCGGDTGIDIAISLDSIDQYDPDAACGFFLTSDFLYADAEEATVLDECPDYVVQWRLDSPDGDGTIVITLSKSDCGCECDGVIVPCCIYPIPISVTATLVNDGPRAADPTIPGDVERTDFCECLEGTTFPVVWNGDLEYPAWEGNVEWPCQAGLVNPMQKLYVHFFCDGPGVGCNQFATSIGFTPVTGRQCTTQYNEPLTVATPGWPQSGNDLTYPVLPCTCDPFYFVIRYADKLAGNNECCADLTPPIPGPIIGGSFKIIFTE